MLVTMGEIIKKHRTAKGMTQGELASIVGVANQTVLRWEKDRRIPNIVELLTIADTLDIPSYSLLELSDTVKKKRLGITRFYENENGSIKINFPVEDLLRLCENVYNDAVHCSETDFNKAIPALTRTIAKLKKARDIKKRLEIAREKNTPFEEVVEYIASEGFSEDESTYLLVDFGYIGSNTNDDTSNK